MIKLQERYQPRSIRFLELWEEMGWRLKVYGIAYKRDYPRPDLVEAGKRVALELLRSTGGVRHYSTGFMGAHDGRGANFCLCRLLGK